MLRKETKQAKRRDSVHMGNATENRLLGRGLSEEMIFKQKSAGKQ